jgi:hypothetical protein
MICCGSKRSWPQLRSRRAFWKTTQRGVVLDIEKAEKAKNVRNFRVGRDLADEVR